MINFSAKEEFTKSKTKGIDNKVRKKTLSINRRRVLRTSRSRGGV